MKHDRILEMADRLDLNMMSLNYTIMELTDPSVRDQLVKEGTVENNRQTSLAEFLNDFPERMDSMCRQISDMQNELLQVVTEQEKQPQASNSMTR